MRIMKAVDVAAVRPLSRHHVMEHFDDGAFNEWNILINDSAWYLDTAS